MIADLETPVVLIDHDVLKRNIGRAAEIARSNGIAMRPHIKTHKSVEIARMQIAAGAAGVTVAKTAEALVFIEAGIVAITLAHPLVDERKVARVISEATRRGTNLRLIADSTVGVDVIGAAAAATGTTVEIQIKVDVGLHRCGVDPASDAALQLARRISQHPNLAFAGILSHAGHAYSAATADEIRLVAQTEKETLTRIATSLRHNDIGVPVISVGCTPTVWLADGFTGLTEIRPGNYVFMDLMQVALGVVERTEIALSVIATVVSVNDRYAITDAGSKVLSSDRGPHGSTRLAGYGAASRLLAPDEPEMPVVSLSEEHGFVAHGGRPPRIGERLRILPNHACTVVNLARTLLVIKGDDTLSKWPVDAHGCVT
jgi:D-serine deaminase-like pyridoxal phosphate-dependent protein